MLTNIESNFFTFLKRRYCSFNICITIVLNSPPSLHLSCTLYWIELFGWQLKSANYSLITNRSLQWSRLLDKRVGMRTHRKLDYRSKRKLEVLKVSINIHFWNFETSTRIFFIHFFPFIYMFVYEMVDCVIFVRESFIVDAALRRLERGELWGRFLTLFVEAWAKLSFSHFLCISLAIYFHLASVKKATGISRRPWF